MSVTVFLQKFQQGKEVPLPFVEVVAFMSRYGVIGEGIGGYEVTFPADEIADLASFTGTGDDGIFCICAERPLYADSFRNFAFDAMQQFGLVLIDDGLTDIYVLDHPVDDLPNDLLEESENGVTTISTAQHIWPPSPH